MYELNYIGIGAIYDPSAKYATLCKDGSRSSSSSKYACSTRGGVQAFDHPAEPCGSNFSLGEVYRIPLAQIFTDTSLFQGRHAAYSQESVKRIVDAAGQGEFSWAAFDPITVWKAPNGRLFVLSGHSRFEAFKRLSTNNTEFQTIPAKIFQGTKKEARRLALESNTLSTKERDTERADYYRSLNLGLQDLRKVIRKNEGNNANRILSYVYLSPSGKTYQALNLLEEGEETSRSNIKEIARWIGSARMKFQVLTRSHENEMYDFLTVGGYGKSYTRIHDWIKKIESVIQQRSFMGQFDSEKPLNLANLGQQSYGERQFSVQENELKAQIKEMKRDREGKLKELASRGASPSDIERILSPYDAALRNLHIKLSKLLSSKTAVLAASRNQGNLFALSGLPAITIGIAGIGVIHNS